LRIVRRLAVFLLVAAPIGFVVGTNQAGAVVNSTTDTFTGTPASPVVYGSETIGTATFASTVIGNGPGSDFPEGTTTIAANSTTICSSDFGSANTTVTVPTQVNYSCTAGSSSGYLLPVGNYTVNSTFAPGTPSASLVGFSYTGSSGTGVPYDVTQASTTLSTNATAETITAGTPINDEAILGSGTDNGAAQETGTITFKLYNAACPSGGTLQEVVKSTGKR